PYALALWLLGVLAVLATHVRCAFQLERRWRAAAPFRSARVQARLETWLGASRAGTVRIRTSTAAIAPVLLAGWQPRILVPESCRALDESRFDLLLAHEAAHVRRHDLALGLVPALAHALLWFFPLAHLAVEEYAQAREEACDAEAVLAGDHALHPYGELLLAYGIDPQRRLHTAASYGSRHASRLHRRLTMLAHGFRPTSRQRALGLAALVFIGLIALVPVRLVAARDTHGPAGGAGQYGSDEAAASGQAASPRHAGSRGAGQSRSTTSASSPRHVSGSYGYTYSTDDDENGFSFGYGRGDHLTLNGSFRHDDFRGVQGLGKDGREFGWFRLEGLDYVVYDARALDRIREIMAPQAELGERQGELGERQGALGEQQGELGRRQGEIGEQQSEFSVRLGELETRLASGRWSDARRSELRRTIAEIEDRLEALEAEQHDLSEHQEALSKQQDELGVQQEALGQQQEELSQRSRVQMRKLADELIESGVAQRRVQR
ncbi:MAG: M56 family metallopeptidase, partial [Candidatus Eisenbacteria bacterium]